MWTCCVRQMLFHHGLPIFALKGTADFEDMNKLALLHIIRLKCTDFPPTGPPLAASICSVSQTSAL